MARCGKIEYDCGEVIVRNRGRIPVGCARRPGYLMPLARGVVAFGNGNHGGGNANNNNNETKGEKQ